MSSGASRATRTGSLGSAQPQIQTVGTLLAAIANCLTDALRIFTFADKQQWGPDEFEQVRALEATLNEAKKDFQEMAPLVHGSFYYENDRTPDSLHRLQSLLARFQFHTQNFRDWARQGGPINPTWARDTVHLRRDLHRAQCRAASRIFAALVVAGGDLGGARCLGAFQVYRRLKRREAERAERAEKARQEREERKKIVVPAWRGSVNGNGPEYGVGMEAARQPGDLVGSTLDSPRVGRGKGQNAWGDGEGDDEDADPGKRRSLEELAPTCNEVGRFQIFGAESHDAVFICDFCDGHIVWPDLQSVPSERSPLPPTAVTGYPRWQAQGISAEDGEQKTVVFAPLAIANHTPPEPGEWQAGLLCPYCEEATYLDQGEDSSELRYVSDGDGWFADLEAFRAHLEWYHTALPVPPLSSIASAATSNCSVM
ncbi:uncharacterized protein C8A04DRAFT_12040 [Dichotomopilus funicola]|uniref:Uncharacterized protein n=1 Tax=Dichotomopilus funicola TaxID=1934379 RepID=A0AAN6V2T8_9PEZI|nr:hypothetical protein C8A04DRAFT_12040 [Dichotomopilus funicola]